MTAVPAPDARVGGPAARTPLLQLAVGGALVALVLVLAGAAGAGPLALVVLVGQALLALGLLALVDAPAAGGTFGLAGAAAVAADAAVLLDGGAAPLAGVVGLSLVAALLVQLARRGRTRVTEALAATMLVVLLTACAACLPAVRHGDGGRELLLAALVGAAAALGAGRAADLLLPRPALAVGAVRGWPGLLLGLGAGVAAAAAVAGGSGRLSGVGAALVGLLAAAAVAVGDLAVDLAAAELRAGWRDARRVAALRPVGLLLPFALLGPVTLLAGRLLLPRMRRLLVGLLVLGVLLVAVDRVAVRVAERVVSAQVRRAAGLAEAPDVRIGGFPFLTQALSGRYDDVRLTTSGVVGGTRVRRLEADLRGLRLPPGQVLRRDVRQVPVEAVRARALVGYAELSRRAGRGRLLSADGTRLRVEAAVTVLGRTARYGATGSVRLERGTLRLRPQEFSTVGGPVDAALGRLLGDRLDVDVRLPRLPFGLALTGLAVRPDGVELTAASGPTVLGP